MPPDAITLTGLKITSWVGVPDDERAQPQSLAVTVEMTPTRSLRGLDDCLNHTIDYAVAARQIQETALATRRQLIETLAEDIATTLLAAHPLQRVTVEVRKFILPHCDHVAVRLSKEQTD